MKRLTSSKDESCHKPQELNNKPSRSGSTSQFIDSRPEAITQRKLQNIANQYAQAKFRNATKAIQRFPYSRTNQKTNRTFLITHTGGSIIATQVKGDEDDLHSGTLNYNIRTTRDGKIFELGHIISDPELGSGLGSLLVYYMTKVAQALGFETIEIPTAAATAVGFYEHMGWQSLNAQRTSELEHKYANVDIDKEAIDKYIGHKVRASYNSNEDNHKMKKRDGFWSPKTQLRWDDLDDKERERLLNEERKAFSALPIRKQAAIVATQHHNMAIANTGMIGNTSLIMAKSFASVQNTWIDNEKPSWQKAEASRLDTNHLTEFPRHPDE